jgi:ribosome biogenesis GTPase A
VKTVEQPIQWYPGHMAAAMRRIDRYFRAIDVVIEVVDARVPRSGANTNLASLAGRRPRLIVLTREDLADPAATVKWLMYFERLRRRAVAVNSKRQRSIAKIRPHLAELVSEHGDDGNKRAIVVGVPNSGKSSVINALVRRAAAATENRPGVTRGLQWFRINPHLELMDTPGILVPKIETAQAQWMLALTGAIPSERYDPEDVVDRFTTWLKSQPGKPPDIPDLQTFATRRGFVRRGSTSDLHNAARSYIKSFNDGTFGRLTLEPAPNEREAA